MVVLFAIIEVVFLFTASLAMPGVIARVGIVRIGIANLLAAGVLARFFVVYHRSAAAEKLEQGAHPAERPSHESRPSLGLNSARDQGAKSQP